MKIQVKTLVEQNLTAVKEGFTKELFLALNPPFPKVDLLQFDGCKKGDVVSLRLKFPFFSQVWTSDIVEDSESEEEWKFVDVGVKLPFFLKTWEHRHIVRKTNQGSEIIDDIDFTTGTILTDFIMYPGLIVQFINRRPIYKRWFKKKAT